MAIAEQSSRITDQITFSEHKGKLVLEVGESSSHANVVEEAAHLSIPTLLRPESLLSNFGPSTYVYDGQTHDYLLIDPFSILQNPIIYLNVLVSSSPTSNVPPSSVVIRISAYLGRLCLKWLVIETVINEESKVQALPKRQRHTTPIITSPQ